LINNDDEDYTTLKEVDDDYTEDEDKRDEENPEHIQGLEICNNVTVLGSISIPEQIKLIKSQLEDENATILDYMFRDAEKRRIVNYEYPITLLASSYAAGILNLINTRCESFCPLAGITQEGCTRYKLPARNEKGFIHRQKPIANLRVHVLIVGEPGTGKNLFMSLFLDPKYGYLQCIGVPNSKPKGMTYPGYAGTVQRDNKGKQTNRYGIAKKYCAGFIGIPEFTDITRSAGESSTALHNAFLEIMEDGEFSRPMANGTLFYYSFSTLWAGTQPGERLNISSGLERRFTFYVINMTKELRDAYDRAKKERHIAVIDEDFIHAIRAYMYQLYRTQLINGIEWSEEYEKYTESIINSGRMITNSDIEYIDNVALGYNFLVYYLDNNAVLHVNLDDRLKALIERLVDSRLSVAVENKLEKDMFTDYLLNSVPKFKDKPVPIRMWDLIYGISKSQTLSFSDVKEKIIQVIKEGYIGTFIYPERYKLDARNQKIENTNVRYIDDNTIYLNSHRYVYAQDVYNYKVEEAYKVLKSYRLELKTQKRKEELDSKYEKAKEKVITGKEEESEEEEEVSDEVDSSEIEK